MGDAVPVCLLQAEGLGIKIGIIPEAGHDLGVILQDRVRVLEVRCQTAVLGLDRPAVFGLGDLAVVLADHRLNGNGHAGHKAGAAALMAVVGHIFPSTTVKEGDIKNKMIEWILDSGRPCVTLEELIPYMSSAAMNQWNGMQDMVDHLFSVHGIRTFGFLGGYTDTCEADLRKNATVDYIEKHGLVMRPQWIRDGIYEYSDGMEYATDLLLAYEQQKEIPQAVVCANDVMAAGIIDGLSDTPLQNKIAVTGFDHLPA